MRNSSVECFCCRDRGTVRLGFGDQRRRLGIGEVEVAFLPAERRIEGGGGPGGAGGHERRRHDGPVGQLERDPHPPSDAAPVQLGAGGRDQLPQVAVRGGRATRLDERRPVTLAAGQKGRHCARWVHG